MIHLHQGKALGGSSALNAHVFVPPAKGVIDSWETLGNEGWNWNGLKTHLSKAYTTPTVDKATEKVLGIDSWARMNDAAKGPIQTSFSGDISHPVREVWADSFKESGHFMPEDPFLNGSVGSFSCLATIDPVQNERSYSANAYYSPVKGRDNLQVLTNAHVEKVLTQKESEATKAIGVQFTQDGESKTVLAIKEVIIAAGVFQSPKILELSGIGNKQLLTKHGIDVVEHLPGVGENLQDHAIVYTGFKAVDDVATLDSLIRQEPEALQQAMQEYGATQSGPMSSCGVYSYAYLPVLEHASDEGRKALKTLLDKSRPDSGSSAEDARAQAYYDAAERTLLDQKEPSGAYVSALAQITIPLDANAEKPPAALPGKFITIGSILSQPLSRGSVHVRSKDPSAQPIIDPLSVSSHRHRDHGPPCTTNQEDRQSLAPQQLAGEASDTPRSGRGLHGLGSREGIRPGQRRIDVAPGRHMCHAAERQGRCCGHESESVWCGESACGRFECNSAHQYGQSAGYCLCIC